MFRGEIERIPTGQPLTAFSGALTRVAPEQQEKPIRSLGDLLARIDAAGYCGATAHDPAAEIAGLVGGMSMALLGRLDLDELRKIRLSNVAMMRRDVEALSE